MSALRSPSARMRVYQLCLVSAIAVLLTCALSGCGGTQTTKTVTVTTAETSASTTTTATQPHAAKRSKGKARIASAMRSCDATIVAKRATTSCRFAENVFYGFWKAQNEGDDAFTAYSPVTKQSYHMSCTSGTTVVCRAGDGAEVRFPRRRFAPTPPRTPRTMPPRTTPARQAPRPEAQQAQERTAALGVRATVIRTTRVRA
jgi:hypothetical protein